MEWLKKLRRSSLKVWLPITIFLLGTVFVLLRLASGRIPGVPDAPLKNVTVYYLPGAEKSPLALFLEPPTSILQVNGPHQLLALQFTNNTKSTITLEPVEVQPDACFQLHETGTPLKGLAAGQTHVAFYDLSAKTSSAPDSTAACDGQYPLTIHYAFSTPVPASKGHPATTLRNERSVSTSSILITSHHKLSAEKFFRIAGALAIPLLLAVATFLIQQFQDQKAQQQKEQELKLEVWKIIFPMIDGYMRKYYVPISRQMEAVRRETCKPASTVNTMNLVASLLVLRADVNLLAKEVGGLYFRSKTAEIVGSELMNKFWSECYAIAVDEDLFSHAVDAVAPTDNVSEAKGKLVALGTLEPATQAFLTRLQTDLGKPTNLTKLDRYLVLIIQVLDFENNLLWYPEWYKTPPRIAIKGFSPTNLGLTATDEQELQATIKEYGKEVPRECRLR